MNMKTMLIVHDVVEYRSAIEEVAEGFNVIIEKDQSKWKNYVEEAEVMLGWRKEMNVEEFKNLRFLQSWSAGVDTLPLTELKEKKVFLSTASGVHAYPISETIFGLLLSLTRKIHTYVRNQLEKKWHNSGLSLELHEKTIGIIGMVAIGKETAKIAKAFNMKTLGLRHSGKEEKYVDEMYTTKDLPSFLPHCDYVVITLPLTEDTHGMFGEEQFKQMKNSAFLVNIGRGELVRERELIHALQNAEIAGAGLDVFEQEPLEENSPLWELPNVIVTPHTSGATEYYAKRVVEDIFLPNVKDYLSGKTPPINTVDYEKGY
ncbi:D-2-hydroxyacid dehydrogenase [Priestia endophytica]|uniref:D-2-hydroxyacid dehydrogenase n=1 Tax=Priestia endophytica TaxID=135735 RepID=UPI000DCA9588|nr:D-2-hydroxyacid dehydrogenase [Priestia endophytica]RAS75883.1 hydroxyacid dehydrogenase [Priestia endophytica]